MNKSLHILLVDDDLDDKQLFEEALSEIDIQTRFEHFANGPDALKWLAVTEDFPHCIFLDLNMPRMNGKEVLVEIRKHAHLGKIPIIIYSTSNNESEKEECRHLGATLYITKPYRLSQLKEAILFAFETVKF